MKKIVKSLVIITTITIISGVIAGIIDRIQQKQREKKAKEAGRSIHKPYGFYEKYIKRPMDFILSMLALVVLSPVLIVTAIMVKAKLGSPVLFNQKRPGRDEEIFTIHKFRTMTQKRDENGELLPDEKRLTGFGKFLRSTSLDELIELWNIVNGTMSIVGPRPLLVEYLPLYNEKQHHRHDVRPGLTSLSASKKRNLALWEEKFEDDVKYVEKITFLGDLKIIFDTVMIVLKRDGISSKTSATMEMFMGSEKNDQKVINK